MPLEQRTSPVAVRTEETEAEYAICWRYVLSWCCVGVLVARGALLCLRPSFWERSPRFFRFPRHVSHASTMLLDRSPCSCRSAGSVCCPHSVVTPPAKKTLVGTDFDSPMTRPTPGSTESAFFWPDANEAVGGKASQPRPVAPAWGSPTPVPLTQHPPPTSGTAGSALRGLSFGPATNACAALFVDYYTTIGPSPPAWREGREITLTANTLFAWNKIVTHCFLLGAFCAAFCASRMLLKADGCVLRVFRVIYVPVSLPLDVPLGVVGAVFRVFPVLCVSHNFHHHHFIAF